MLEHRSRAFDRASSSRDARAYATHGRTHARTDVDGKRTSEKSPFVTRTGGQSESTRTRSENPVQDLFDTLGLSPKERAEVTRRGEREPISRLVRGLIYRRDQYTCQFCGSMPWGDGSRRSGPLHLDHITPWSAGGSDRSDNLRTLCGPCNEDRSNFITGREEPALGIVRICVPCLTMPTFVPDGAFDVYCARLHHASWAIPGWQIL